MPITTVGDVVSVFEDGERYYGSVIKVHLKECEIFFYDGDEGVYGYEELAEYKISCEGELRKYVRRLGGFCQGVTEDQKKRARQMLKNLGRTELSWDKTIIPFHSEMRTKA